MRKSTVRMVGGSAEDQSLWAIGGRARCLDPFTGLPLLLAGTGAAMGGYGSSSVTAIVTGGFGHAPHFVYSWRDAVARGANGHRRP